MDVIKLGDKGELVKDWQYFLRGISVYMGIVDGDFGEKTKIATRTFQVNYGLDVDGVVGNGTWAKAIEFGFDEDTVNGYVDKKSSAFPEPPEFKPLVTNKEREKIFGKIEFKHTPSDNNPEKITITNSFAKDNIVKLTIPQLIPVKGSGTAAAFFHPGYCG